MYVAFFDCFSGIAGDMILGALCDLGVDGEFIKKQLKKINISGYAIEIKKIKKNQISAIDVYISVKEKQHHRSLLDIYDVINNSDLDNDVKELSKKIFNRLAEAESKIHDIEIENVHFHEVGAIDSIIDVVGAAICLKKLGVEKVFCSDLPLGKGFVKCSHGIIPIPAPATLELLKNVPVYQSVADHEMVTPTGAAIITTIAEVFGKMPPMRITKIGYGAGKIKSSQPGLLRVYLGILEK
ncbi:MAG: nickel pincer cofactor biosynthesis protein LarC [Candidatus Thermoplasmatota archaeon]|nr:nickel pincer cofactor biosynthesis protein LarC [Candidatus Thermoplasmatota archaeon]